MSKQLAISAAFSTFAMAAFALLATPVTDLAALDGNAGAPSSLEAPAFADLPAIGD
jgi:hypothetical protein